MTSEDKIERVLEDKEVLSAKEIAKRTEIPKKEVNSILYSWLKNKEVCKTEDMPPLWYFEKSKEEEIQYALHIIHVQINVLKKLGRKIKHEEFEYMYENY